MPEDVKRKERVWKNGRRLPFPEENLQKSLEWKWSCERKGPCSKRGAAVRRLWTKQSGKKRTFRIKRGTLCKRGDVKSQFKDSLLPPAVPSPGFEKTRGVAKGGKPKKGKPSKKKKNTPKKKNSPCTRSKDFSIRRQGRFVA